MPSIDPRTIGRAFRLERRDRVRAARALGWLIAASAAVRLLPYETLIRVISRIPSSARTAISAGDGAAAVRRASRLWPATCLPLAVAGYCLLRRGGRAPVITLGVAKQGGRFDAHAWLECDGVTVTGERADQHYAPLAASRRQPS